MQLGARSSSRDTPLSVPGLGSCVSRPVACAPRSVLAPRLSAIRLDLLPPLAFAPSWLRLSCDLAIFSADKSSRFYERGETRATREALVCLQAQSKARFIARQDESFRDDAGGMNASYVALDSEQSLSARRAAMMKRCQRRWRLEALGPVHQWNGMMSTLW